MTQSTAITIPSSEITDMNAATRVGIIRFAACAIIAAPLVYSVFAVEPGTASDWFVMPYLLFAFMAVYALLTDENIDQKIARLSPAKVANLVNLSEHAAEHGYAEVVVLPGQSPRFYTAEGMAVDNWTQVKAPAGDLYHRFLVKAAGIAGKTVVGNTRAFRAADPFELVRIAGEGAEREVRTGTMDDRDFRVFSVDGAGGLRIVFG